MSGVGDRLRRIDPADVGIALAAVVAVVGIASVFGAADVSGLGRDSTRVLLGVCGIAVGGFFTKRWIDTDPGSYRPPERERVRSVGVPGDDVDDLLRLRAIARSPEAIRFYRSRSRDELQEIAIDVLDRYQGHTREQARARLRDGSWTDDETAAEFFRLGTDGGAAEELDTALRQRRGGEHPYTKRARRAVEELARIAGSEASGRVDARGGADGGGAVGGGDGDGGDGDESNDDPETGTRTETNDDEGTRAGTEATATGDQR